MWANLLNPGDTIGIISPSHVAVREEYRDIIAGIEARGFRVKTAANLYRDTYGYLASEQERADDLNEMVLDDQVKMIFFGGGNGSIDLLPYIDYEAIRAHPKLFLSYSDGTSILDAVYSKTGLITYYGQTPGEFLRPTDYTCTQFDSQIVRGDAEDFVSNSLWQCLNPGVCTGLMVGGYLLNFALMLNTPYFSADPEQKYILFLEDHEMFSNVAMVDMLLSHIEQNDFIRSVSGLLFGNYSEKPCPWLLERLTRFGRKHGIPAVYCDDFGHGQNHAILPIGGRARLDAGNCTMRFLREE